MTRTPIKLAFVAVLYGAVTAHIVFVDGLELIRESILLPLASGFLATTICGSNSAIRLAVAPLLSCVTFLLVYVFSPGYFHLVPVEIEVSFQLIVHSLSIAVAFVVGRISAGRHID